MRETQWPRGFRVLVLGLLFVLASLAALAGMLGAKADPDMFWHVETGRWIVEHGTVPHTDVFSWYGRSAGLPWVPHEWLWDVGAYGAWRLGGYGALYAVSGALYGLLVLLCFWWLRDRLQDDLRALAITIVMMAGLYVYATARPQVLTYVLLVALFIALEREKWFVAPLIVLVVANTHGATYPLFLFIVALYTLPRKPLPFALSVAAILAQPQGLAMLAYPFSSSPESQALQEWVPTVLVRQPVMLVALIAFAVLVRWREVRWRDAVLAAAGAGLSILAVRHVAFFFLLAVPSLAPYLPQTAAPDLALRRRVDRLLVAVLALGCLGMGVLAIAEPLDVDDGYPVGASAYLRENGIENYWNLWQDGGYLIAEGMEPFVDGRADPFFSDDADGGRFISDYMETVTMKRDIRPFLRRHGVEYVMVGKDRDLHVALSQSRSFDVVYDDDSHSVFRFVDARESGQAKPASAAP